ncbi:hypothetical protein MXD61_14645, partial [Frankia sp. AgPm24]|uniref:hypothetical protein n=1 Tax=Frankia sp. AgPm24 TaxID=631128 RepID=UPI00200BC2BD
MSAPSGDTSRRRPACARVPTGRVPLTVLLLLGLVLGLAGGGAPPPPPPPPARPRPPPPPPARAAAHL